MQPVTEIEEPIIQRDEDVSDETCMKEGREFHILFGLVPYSAVDTV